MTTKEIYESCVWKFEIQHVLANFSHFRDLDQINLIILALQFGKYPQLMTVCRDITTITYFEKLKCLIYSLCTATLENHRT